MKKIELYSCTGLFHYSFETLIFNKNNISSSFRSKLNLHGIVDFLFIIIFNLQKGAVKKQLSKKLITSTGMHRPINH